MKMAKATEADLQAATDLVNALEALNDRWIPVMPEAIERLEGDRESEHFDLYDDEQCRRALTYLLNLSRQASIGRVVFGMLVLLDPLNKVVDPDLDHLELHPEHRQASVLPNITGLTESQKRDVEALLNRGLSTWVDAPEWLIEWHDSIACIPRPGCTKEQLEGVAA
jgi:hypothetical protein